MDCEDKIWDARQEGRQDGWWDGRREMVADILVYLRDKNNPYLRGELESLGVQNVDAVLESIAERISVNYG